MYINKKLQKIDQVGQTMRYEVKLCTESVYEGQQWLVHGGNKSV